MNAISGRLGGRTALVAATPGGPEPVGFAPSMAVRRRAAPPFGPAVVARRIASLPSPLSSLSPSSAWSWSWSWPEVMALITACLDSPSDGPRRW
ncbi:hypothetical protein [Micromonospora musae]|uniref:hypothetical protein n=1 Tax=Micromonospora musae TaxID=1894970 RepID=UPI0033FDE393